MILQILLLCLGFVFLVKGADFFVNGAAGIAAKDVYKRQFILRALQ